MVSLTSRMSVVETLRTQGNVLFALILRDIGTRFGSAPAFVMAILWPLSHILILVSMNVALGRVAPYGESSAIWFSTGIVPFMVFSYTARFVMLGIVLNRPLLAFPNIKMLDILFSRAIIEFFISCLVIIVLIIIFLFFDIEFMPVDKAQAILALLAAFWVGMGMGILNAMIAMVFIQWITFFSLFIVFLWLTSGVLFVPSHMPEFFRNLLYFHPAVHLSEWIRTAYFDSYNSLILDKPWLLINATIWMLMGLTIERAVRGRLLAG